MEKRYAGKSLQNVLADYCWNLTEEMSIGSYKRRSYRESFNRDLNQTFIFVFILCNCIKVFLYSILTVIFECLMFIST
jgi:hypothetical protein